MVELGEVCEIYQPKTITSKEIKQTGKYKVFGANGVIGFYDKYNHEDAEVLVTCRGATCGTVNLSEPKSWITGNAMVVKPKDNLDKKFLFYFLKNTNLKSVISGSAQPQITRASLSPFKIPLPPLEVQKEIVEQIEVKQKAIKAAKAVIENLERERRYFGQSLRKLEGVEWVDLGEVCTFKYGKPLKEVDRKGGEYPVYGSNGIVGYHDDYLVEGPFIIVGRKGTAGAVVYSEKSGFPIDTTFYVQLKDQKVDLKFLYLIMQTLNLGKINTQAGVPGLNRNDAYKTKILLPSLEIQKQLVAEMEEQEKIIEANKKLVGIMEQKIAEVLREI
jgi:restriction endonuclease S subunit